MKGITTAIGLALAAAVAVPASAQATKTEEKAPAINVSRAAFKEVKALQDAVDKKDLANIPARLAAAEAAAKTADDKYAVETLRLKAGSALNDPALIERAVEALLASGKHQASFGTPIYLALGNTYFQAKQYDQAARAIEKVLAVEPNNLDATIVLAETRNAQGRAADSVTLIQKAIALKAAAGQKADENWYKRALDIANRGKLPVTVQVSREWVQAYPTATNWATVLQLYRQSSQLDDSTKLDLYRLARASKGLNTEFDFYSYADLLLKRGLPGEAKAVLEEGVAAGKIKRTDPDFGPLITVATTKTTGDRAALDASAKTALAAPAARQAITIGDAYYGYGEYAKAAELYRAALGKTDADKDLINLRIGMALAAAGDKAGARAALSAVSGARAELAKFWLVHIGTSA